MRAEIECSELHFAPISTQFLLICSKASLLADWLLLLLLKYMKKVKKSRLSNWPLFPRIFPSVFRTFRPSFRMFCINSTDSPSTLEDSQVHLLQAREEVATSLLHCPPPVRLVHLQVSDPGEGCTQQSRLTSSQSFIRRQLTAGRMIHDTHTIPVFAHFLQHRCAAVSCTEFQGKVRRMKSIFGTIKCGIIITINNNLVSGDVGFVEKLTKYRFFFLRFEIRLLHLVEKNCLVADSTVEFEWNVQEIAEKGRRAFQCYTDCREKR